MEIVVGDIYSQIVQPKNHIRELAIVRDVCRARPNGYQFMPRYKSKMWDGYISLMNSPISFPTGLLGVVERRLQDEGYKYSISNQSRLLEYPEFLHISKTILLGIILRNYQINAATDLLLASRGIAKMATNSGKTEVMAVIIKALGFPKTLVFVHRKELLYQTAERFTERLGIHVGMIGDGVWDIDTVTVCMIQTFHSKMLKYKWTLDKWAGNRLVMIDECHTASSDSYMDALKIVPGPWRFGFSGTPLKHDNLSDLKLISMTGDVVVEVTNKELIESEYSAKPIIHLTQFHDKEFWVSDYMPAYDECIINNGPRNAAIASRATTGGSVLVLVNRVEHGKVLEQMIDGAEFVSGEDTTERRRYALDKLRDRGGIIIASPIFDEGVDIPALDCVILAGGGKSHVKLLQRIGRGLRKKSGDNTLHVYDFIDHTNKHLYRHSLERIKTYEQEQFEIQRI